MDVSARLVTVPLGETFVIARSSQDEVELCQVELRHDGVSGHGEAAAIGRYGESAESARTYIEAHGDLLGDDPFSLDEIFERLPRREFAARAALDGALHDLCGKLAGQPVWRLLGLRRAGPPTSWTVWLGDPDDMARRAKLAAPRFQRLKLKLGGGGGVGVGRVRAVRAATDRPLQVDVNEYWTLDEALENLPQLEIDYCEQPLPAGDPGGPELKRRSPVPIFVDEDCHTLADVAACAERALGLGVMLGCMVESGLSVAAGAQIASLMDHVDLDGNLLLAHDPWPGVEFVDGVQLPSNEPGLGVREAIPDPR